MTERKPKYDLPTAITFFLAGLGAGMFLAMIRSSRSNPMLSPLQSRPRSVTSVPMEPNLERLRAL